MIFSEHKDGYRNSQNMEYFYTNMEFSTFIEESKNIVLLRSTENKSPASDLYIHTLSYLVAPWATSSSGLYLVAALIYGALYISGINKIYNKIKGHWNIILYILFFVFVFWKSFEGINSIKNWTAAWIYFNGAISYFQTRKKKYILYVLIAPFVHFAYLIMTIPFYVVLLFGNRPKIYIAIIILSFIFSLSNTSFLMDAFLYTKLGAEKVDQYVREGGAESYLIERESSAFHAKFYLIAGKIFISILFYYTIATLGYITKSRHNYLTMSLASVGLLSISISNFSTNIFALYSRMFNNAGFYILAYLILIYYSTHRNKKNKTKIFNFNLLTILSLPFVVLFVFTQWSQIGEFTDVRILISPVFYPFIGDEAMSLKDLIKALI